MKFLLFRGLTLGAALNFYEFRVTTASICDPSTMSPELRTWTAIWPHFHTVFSHILHRSLHWQATSPKAITGFQPTSPKAYPPIITGLGLSTTNNHNHKPLLIEHPVSEGGHFWLEFEAVSHNPPCLLLAFQFLWLTPSPFFWFKPPEHPGLGGTSQAVREGFKVMLRLIPPIQKAIHGGWWILLL